MPDEGFGVVRDGFTMLPNQLMSEVADASIWAVYAVVYRHGNGSAEGCWCSQQQVSKESGVYLKGVRRALSWLEEHGWLQASRRIGGTTVYRVIVQDPERKRPRSKTTQVENDLGGRSKTTQGGRSKTTYKQDPYKQDPQNKIPVGRAAADAAPTDRSVESGRGERRKRFKPQTDDVPLLLQPVATDVLEFWEGKQGAKSEAAWKRLMAELELIANDPHGGMAVVEAQLHTGIQSGNWSSITYANWQKYGRATHQTRNGSQLIGGSRQSHNAAMVIASIQAKRQQQAAAATTAPDPITAALLQQQRRLNAAQTITVEAS